MNSEAIILRVKQVLEHYSLTSSTFADSINVQRSSISHLMSGRNKPSLDFVMKITDNYPEVDLQWLLNGKGSFPKQIGNSYQTSPTIPSDNTEADLFSFQENSVSQVKSEKQPEKSKKHVAPINSINDVVPEKKSNTRFSATDKNLIKVILFYDDGSFDAYNA